jgi:amino acid adenylation domain-containing protein
MKTHIGAVVTSELDADLAIRLQQVATAHQLTPFMLIHAALSLVLSRHSNSNDIVIGTPVANRLQVELESLIGLFVNTLVLRVDTTQQSVEDYLAHIRTVNLDAQAHQDIGFEQLVEHCNVVRSTRHNPLFQIMLSMSTVDQSDSAITGVNFTPLQNDAVAAKFDLSINAQVTDQGIHFTWVYDTSLFNVQRITTLSEHLNRLLTALLESPQVKLGDLPMLSQIETQYLIDTLNDTQVDYSPAHSPAQLIDQLFEAQVEQAPDNIAVVFGQQSLTYRALNEAANRLAHYLRSQGVTTQTMVGVCAGRGPQMIIAIMAVLKAGGAYVPLEPALPKARLRDVVTTNGMTCLLTEAQWVELFDDITGLNVIALDAQQTQQQLASCSPSNLSGAIEYRASNLAYVIYTSGSSGKPKGVMVSHRALCNYVLSIRDLFSLTPGLSFGLLTSVATDLGNTTLFPSLAFGGTLHVLSEAQVVDSDYVCNYLKDNQVDVLKLTPSHFNALFSNQALTQFSVRWLFLGGEKADSTTGQKLSMLVDKGVRVINHYGPTEATIGCCTFELSNPISGTDIPIGRPLSNVCCYVLSVDLNLLPFGAIGELHIGGAGLASGYLNQRELSAQKFIQNPFSDDAAQRLYKTGDLVRYLPDGNLLFVGRIDDQVKIRGFRVEPGEIESQLSRCDGVISSVVLAAEEQLVAYLVTGQNASVDAVRQQLQNCLPHYMVPSAFMVLDELPLTNNGKVDKKALPKPDGSHLQGVYVAPQGDSEHTLVSIWAELLKLNEDKVSVTANFFELGGHSLLAIRLVAQIRQQLQQELALRLIFDEPTIRALAAYLDLAQYRLDAMQNLAQTDNKFELEI